MVIKTSKLNLKWTPRKEKLKGGTFEVKRENTRRKRIG
jgi:hypothetical protein